MKKLLFYSLMFLSFSKINSQDFKTQINQAYYEYYKNVREQFVFLFNKKSFYPGEKAWFSCYSLDKKTKKIFKKTKKGTLLIYDIEGDLIEKKHLKFDNGITSSFIKIPKNYEHAKIYYKIETSWSRNFKNELHELNIQSDYSIVQKQKSKEQLVEIIPESNNLIEGVTSVVWVKVNGLKNKEVEGIVITEDKEEVGYFKTDNKGIGKFNLKPISNESYEVQIPDLGTFPIKPILKKGVVFNLVEKKDTWFLLFRGNIDAENSDEYSYMIHKNGHIFFSEKLVFENNKRTRWFKKREIDKGLVTISLFKNKQMVSERYFYNNYNDNECLINIIKNKIEKDTTELILYRHCKDSLINLTLSILPIENNFHPSNFKEKILLPKLDFKNKDDLRNELLFKKVELYNWDTILGGKNNIKYFFEKGFSVKGKVKNVKNNNLLKNFFFGCILKNQEIISVKTDSIGGFVIHDLKFYKGDTLNFVSYDNRSKYLNVEIDKPEFKTKIKINRKHKVDYLRRNKENIFYNIDGELLDEVVINGKKINNGDRNSVVNKDKFINPLDKTSFVDNLDITEENVNNYRTIMNYLSSQAGLTVKNNQGTIVIYSKRARYSSITNGGSGASSSGEPMNVYINNNLISGDYLTYLNLIPMNRVKRISVNKSGISKGGNDPFGSINIYLNDRFILPKRKGNKEKAKSNFYIFNELGYENNVGFRVPDYIFDENDEEYKKYAIIHWSPSFVLKNEPSVIKFKVPKSIQKYYVHIRGISNEGKIIDFKKILEN